MTQKDGKLSLAHQINKINKNLEIFFKTIINNQKLIKKQKEADLN